MSAHDLDGILAKVLEHFAPIRRAIHIDWVDLDDVDTDYFKELKEWAAVTRVGRTRCIGLHPILKRAPRFVVEYIVFHEVLHIALETFGHPRYFSVAERLWPTYRKSNAWLSAYFRRSGCNLLEAA
jgi:predicted Co/Zn/Cd cation transporter (cation efflux family)